MKRTAYKEPKFYLDKQVKKHKSPIFLKYSFGGGERISYFTGERIEPDKWNSEKQRVKRNVNGSKEINDILDTIADTAKKAVREARLKNEPLTKEKLRNILTTATGGKNERKTSFFEVLNLFIKTEKELKAWKQNTLKKFLTFEKQLHEFEKFKQKTQKSYKLSFDTVNEVLFMELISYWQNEKNLLNVSTQKNIKLLHWFLNWSHKKGYTTDGFKSIKINLTNSNKQVIFLDINEITAIYKMQIPPAKEYLNKIRDVFIFQCLTGLRYSDIANLKASDIKNNTLHVNTIKTRSIVEIELNETTREIIKKYKEHQDATGYALPVLVNQAYNRELKELARLAGINEKITQVHYKGSEPIERTFEKWQLITTHTARRSFITNGLALGIGSEVIRSWTGHKNDKSFAVYYEIVKKRKKEDIEKMNLPV